jgi:hypothetical protein
VNPGAVLPIIKSEILLILFLHSLGNWLLCTKILLYRAYLKFSSLKYSFNFITSIYVRLWNYIMYFLGATLFTPSRCRCSPKPIFPPYLSRSGHEFFMMKASLPALAVMCEGVLCTYIQLQFAAEGKQSQKLWRHKDTLSLKTLYVEEVTSQLRPLSRTWPPVGVKLVPTDTFMYLCRRCCNDCLRPKRQKSPLGANFPSGVQLYYWGPTSPLRANFTSGGQLHLWGQFYPLMSTSLLETHFTLRGHL